MLGKPKMKGLGFTLAVGLGIRRTTPRDYQAQSRPFRFRV